MLHAISMCDGVNYGSQLWNPKGMGVYFSLEVTQKICVGHYETKPLI